MSQLSRLVLEVTTPPAIVPLLLTALSVTGDDRLRRLEAVVDVLATLPLTTDKRDGILQDIRTEYQLAKAHAVLSDEPSPSSGDTAWQTQNKKEQLQQFMGLGLLRPEMLAELMNRQVQPPMFSPKPTL